MAAIGALTGVTGAVTSGLKAANRLLQSPFAPPRSPADTTAVPKRGRSPEDGAIDPTRSMCVDDAAAPTRREWEWP
ncbi:hypothetical protein, partial [Streptomyces gibsoniae]